VVLLHGGLPGSLPTSTVAPEEGAAEADPPHRSEEVICRERGREIEREREK
jgi:hypothetical protein